MHSTKISGLAVDTDYTFHLVLRTTAGTYTSEKVETRTHKMTDLSGITITTGIMPGSTKEKLTEAVERVGAKLVDGVKIDTTHFVTTEGRGQSWEKAVEMNIPVVRPEWVDACEKNGRILGVTKFYLDAMRPGPPIEEQSTPPIAQRPEPQSQATPIAEEPSKPEDTDEKPPPPPKDIDDETEESDEEQDEPEQKAKPEAEQKSMGAQEQDEQKVRLEDKEEQKVALRPAASNQDLNEDEEDDDEDDETEDSGVDEKKEEAGEVDKAKPATTPGGASFEDVAL